jgi:hypothetical protein
LRLILAIHPDHPLALQSLGRIVPPEEAVCLFERALAVQPDFVPALCSLGALHLVCGRHDAAIGCFQRALWIDPGLVYARINLTGILEMTGRLEEAKRHRDLVPRPQHLGIEVAAAPERTVLLLTNSGKGNVPLGALLPAATTTCITWYVEYADDAQERDLPPFDVAFNVIGNADVMEESLARVSRFHARIPVLNPPAAVGRTRRDVLPQLLAGIPGVVSPPTVRVPKMAMPVVAERLAAAGIGYPVLLRPIVTHGGEGIQRCDTAADLAAVPLPEADAVYAAGHHDYRSPDGYYRKYRMIFIDRVAYAYHLAISPRWLVHYFSADMLAAPWKREEERRFLEDPAAVLGAAAMAAVAAIGRRIDLDFAGIDFAILDTGEVLVFEANATMLVHLQDPIEDFPYKHAAIPAIFAAFTALLDRHAALRG